MTVLYIKYKKEKAIVDDSSVRTRIEQIYITEVKTMLLLLYPRCTTCQKAKKWLDDNHVEYIERHIVEDNPTYEELREWYSQSGLPIKKFFNTSGLRYKELNLKDKIPTMTEDELLKLLATDGMLVKRPLVVNGDRILTGFKEKEWSDALL